MKKKVTKKKSKEISTLKEECIKKDNVIDSLNTLITKLRSDLSGSITTIKELQAKNSELDIELKKCTGSAVVVTDIKIKRVEKEFESPHLVVPEIEVTGVREDENVRVMVMRT